MKKTVFITGSSTGIGKASALLFLEQGWNVVATMRSPEKEMELNKHPNCLVTKLDVHDEASIQNSIHEAIKKFQKIDVLVNNAGYGLVGAFEGMSSEQIKNQFETNVFGLMNVSRAILPHFRENKNGTIINIASVGGKVTFPLYSVYHATKFAVEGFSESLQYEVEKFNIKIKIVEPGAIKTDFYTRSTDRKLDLLPSDYKNFVDHTLKATDEAGNRGSKPSVVAQTIFKAANDNSFKMRYPSGIDAKFLLCARKFMSDRFYQKLVRLTLKL